ncbi:YcfL family protein [Phocoenobacter skyensis]|uniref:YcfL family protein n=1 Tax=Phocoenobacter skyensis TaxID=97481 RepID=A0ABT9JIJ7_9PAST|nr:YcfL family protein [Pasteurella skyensis]MDP8078639.1 YcfL family protein [Pasteurella skyensis]MDP8084633.1 YcfL family protein [Pasteurella skyensis]
MRFTQFVKIIVYVTTVILLSGCVNKASDASLSSETPLINIEERLSQYIEVGSNLESVLVKNKMANPLGILYKVFWYSEQGTTQQSNVKWRSLRLTPNQTSVIKLKKPTLASVNYRIYLRENDTKGI